MSASSSLQFPRFTTLADSAPPRRPRPAPRWSSRRDQRKSPAKRRAGPAFGYAGDGLPSRCIRRYRLPSRCTRQKFHARPEQGNGPAADGASFSLTLKFIGVRKEPLFPSGTKTNSGLGEIVPPAFITRIRQLCACRGPFPAHIFAAGDPTAWLRMQSAANLSLPAIFEKQGDF